jgi:hypothetical protein
MMLTSENFIPLYDSLVIFSKAFACCQFASWHEEGLLLPWSKCAKYFILKSRQSAFSYPNKISKIAWDFFLVANSFKDPIQST